MRNGLPQIKSLPGLIICVNLNNLWINPLINNRRAVKDIYSSAGKIFACRTDSNCLYYENDIREKEYSVRQECH
jgi:hypothetical protein